MARLRVPGGGIQWVPQYLTPPLNRPGGAQARLLAEVSNHEQQRNFDLTLQAFRDYQQGIHPSGPGARELLDFFTSVDARLTGCPSTLRVAMG